MIAFKTIETQNLLLRGITPADMKFIFENLEKSEVMKLLGHETDREFEKEKHKQDAGYATYNRSFLLFLLLDKVTGKIIGRCGLHNLNEDNRRSEIGYVMHNEQFRSRGLMTEAVAAIINYGFKEMQLNRLEALVGVNNMVSLRLLDKFGFVKEGELREHVVTENGYENSVLLSLLRKEYVHV